MDIYEKTADLAHSIKESSEYSEFMEMEKLVKQNPEAREILNEYRAQQFAVSLAEMAGHSGEALNDAFAEICDMMEGNALLRRYLNAETNLTCMIQRINQIFLENLGMSAAAFPMLEDAGEENGGYLN